MPALEKITVKGFKSIASIEDLELRPINVIIGANGSGKSNFVEVFAFLRAIREGRLGEYVSKVDGADKVLHFGSKITSEIEIHIYFQRQTNQYKIVLQPDMKDHLFPSREIVYFWEKHEYSEPFDRSLYPEGKEAAISENIDDKIATHIQQHLDNWRLYHFHDTSSSSPMKKYSKVSDIDYLRSDGSNLAAFLCFLQEAHESSYRLIRRTVQRVAPFFKNFQLKRDKRNPSIIQLRWLHKGSDAYFDASSFSDGTLRFVALATLLLQPKEYLPSVVLVDEPELGLHPYAITLLAALIRQASHETQIIVSTQSSLLLDHFEPEDVLVADRVDGGTKLSRLSSEDLLVWLENYSLGQLWEKNYLGGRPGSE